VTRYTYDRERRVSEIQGPGQRTLGLAWGGFGRLVQKTDAAGGVVRFRYNREGELTEVLQRAGRGPPAPARRRRPGDRARRPSTDEPSSTATIEPGRVVRSEIAGEVTAHVYEAAGNVVKRTLPTTRSKRSRTTRATSWRASPGRVERSASSGTPPGRVVREVQAFRGEEDTVTQPP